MSYGLRPGDDVQVVFLARQASIVLGTVATTDEDGSLTVRLHQPLQVGGGCRAVIEAPPAGDLRVTGVVDGQQGDTVTIGRIRPTLPDRREYPRMIGYLMLRYHVEGPDGDGPTYTALPVMSVSAGGFSFEGSGLVTKGDHLRMEVSLLGDFRRFDARGQVVRTDAHPDVAAPTPRQTITVTLDTPAPELVLALAHMTLREQRRAFGG